MWQEAQYCRYSARPEATRLALTSGADGASNAASNTVPLSGSESPGLLATEQDASKPANTTTKIEWRMTRAQRSLVRLLLRRKDFPRHRYNGRQARVLQWIQ